MLITEQDINNIKELNIIIEDGGYFKQLNFIGISKHLSELIQNVSKLLKKDDFNSFDTFDIKEYHITLLNDLRYYKYDIEYNDFTTNSKRPYGNSDMLGDIADTLNEEYNEENDDKYYNIHIEVLTLLKFALNNFIFPYRNIIIVDSNHLTGEQLNRNYYTGGTTNYKATIDLNEHRNLKLNILLKK